MTIRSQALAAALTAAVALVPAAAADAAKRPTPTPPSPFQATPKNRAAARRIALQNEALGLLNAAIRHVRGTVSGCADRSPFSGAHTQTHDAPGPDFLNAITALRRPATPAEQSTPADPVEAILPGDTYVDYRRYVTAADGTVLTIVMGRRVITPSVVPAHCLDVEHAFLVAKLKGRPHPLRSATLQQFGYYRTGQEAAARQPANATPQDNVYLFDGGSGGGGETFTSFARFGVFGSSGGGEGSSTLYGLVSDGVATVKLAYPRVVSRGRYYKPKVYASSVTLTLPVQQNVVAARIPRSAPDAFAAEMTWLDATGRVVNRTRFPGF